MIEVIEVASKKMQRDFLNFPLKMYKKCEYFVPPLYGDEKLIFSKKNVYYDTCISSYFNAYKDGVMVGRISGIIQSQSNQKTHQNRARFTRFDAINDKEVAKKLFEAVEKWAMDNGADIVCGPLGFSDLEREGLLIEGFDQLSTFEEQYNYEYYGELIESCGYAKEVDWVEYKIGKPKPEFAKIVRLSDAVLKRYNLHIAKGKNKKQYINKYKDGIFSVLDEAYNDLYGTVPFTENMKKQLISQFILIVDLDYIITVLDKDEKVVGFGLGFPSLAHAVQKSSGHLTPCCLFRILHAVKHSKIMDLGLVAVTKEYQNKGVNAIILNHMINIMKNKNIDYCETNLNLEDNEKVQAQWEYFEHTKHKKRRSYIKTLRESKAQE